MSVDLSTITVSFDTVDEASIPDSPSGRGRKREPSPFDPVFVKGPMPEGKYVKQAFPKGNADMLAALRQELTRARLHAEKVLGEPLGVDTRANLEQGLLHYRVTVRKPRGSSEPVVEAVPDTPNVNGGRKAKSEKAA